MAILLILPVIIFFVYKTITSLAKNKVKPTFTNKVIWITGASSGIGEELAYQLSKLGASLILSARRENELERVRRGCANPEKVSIFPLDLSKPHEVLEKAKKFIGERKEKIDILINNGGISQRCTFMENAFDNEISMMNVNYLSQVALTKAILPSMLDKRNGHIVYMNSIQGKVGTGFRTSYAASKHALTGFADALRAEVEESGVWITTIYPGYVKTNIARNSFAGQAGARYGKSDSNIENGLDVDVFAKRTVRAIYLRVREEAIPDKWLHGIAIPLRNLVPNLVFKLIENKRKKEEKWKEE